MIPHLFPWSTPTANAEDNWLAWLQSSRAWAEMTIDILEKTSLAVWNTTDSFYPENIYDQGLTDFYDLRTLGVGPLVVKSGLGVSPMFSSEAGQAGATFDDTPGVGAYIFLIQNWLLEVMQAPKDHFIMRGHFDGHPSYEYFRGETDVWDAAGIPEHRFRAYTDLTFVGGAFVPEDNYGAARGRGTVKPGDILGPWLFEDIKKILNVLAYVDVLHYDYWTETGSVPSLASNYSGITDADGNEILESGTALFPFQADVNGKTLDRYLPDHLGFFNPSEPMLGPSYYPLLSDALVETNFPQTWASAFAPYNDYSDPVSETEDRSPPGTGGGAGAWRIGRSTGNYWRGYVGSAYHTYLSICAYTDFSSTRRTDFLIHDAEPAHDQDPDPDVSDYPDITRTATTSIYVRWADMTSARPEMRDDPFIRGNPGPVRIGDLPKNGDASEDAFLKAPLSPSGPGLLGCPDLSDYFTQDTTDALLTVTTTNRSARDFAGGAIGKVYQKGIRMIGLPNWTFGDLKLSTEETIPFTNLKLVYEGGGRENWVITDL